ncbi:MAG: CPBP family intramembrane metalloprotease [Pirellulales bacterium]|nr:CPBP family intramembrane metalloprotease [Pirellulales bacterium]
MPDSTLISPMAESYWTESRQPLVSLAFIAPMMLIYEVGVWKLGVQNGADAWMAKVLSLMDLRLHIFLPLLMAAILLGWHHLTHHPWRISAGVLSAMAVESLLLAVCLRMVLVLQSTIMLQMAAGQPPSPAATDRIREAVGYLGAGLYEELLFRLILIAAVVWTIRLWLPDRRKSMVLAVLASSLLFAAAHYVGAAGDPFDWFSFSFRILAGLFFAALFIYRGFGITAGSHAFYDISVVVF